MEALLAGRVSRASQALLKGMFLSVRGMVILTGRANTESFWEQKKLQQMGKCGLCACNRGIS